MSFLKKIKRSKKPSDLWVSLKAKEDITPEDTFSDVLNPYYKNSQENKLEILIKPWTTRLLFLAIFGTLTFLASYTILFSWANYEKYSNLSEKNSQRVYEIGHSRGDIISSDGQIIATSTSIFDIIVSPSNISEEDINSMALNISILTKEVSSEYLIERITSAQKKKLASLVLLKNLDKKEISKYTFLLEMYSELSISERSLRTYPYANVFSHIVGYVSSVTKEDLSKYPQYNLADVIGKKGIEYYFESFLKGKKGLFAKYISAKGDIVKEKIISPTVIGATLKLSINAQLQTLTYNIIQDSLNENKIKKGAAIVMDANTGSILALVSLPDFNPNYFVSGLTNNQLELYFNNHANPLFNRVTMGEYAAGSIIKPLIATAALEENIISPNKYIFTQGYITVPSVYDPSIIYRFNDWKNHGAVNMRDAIAVSSNVYFYIVGGGYEAQEGLGIDRISEYLNKFNWGNKLDINFSSEARGLVPTPAWKKEIKNENWKIGDTYNVSIGQGDVLVTPLQVAAATAVFANKGTLYKPYIIEKIYSQDGITQLYESGDIINQKFIAPETINVIREGMRNAVIFGSSKYLLQLPVSSAGKTGTVQTSGEKDNAWFTGFAPYENSEIVVTVLLEEGETSNNAVRAAYRIFEAYFSASGGKNNIKN